jgi:hypothetical protein
MQAHFERATINFGICARFRIIREADTGDRSKCEATFKTNRVLEMAQLARQRGSRLPDRLERRKPTRVSLLEVLC